MFGNSQTVIQSLFHIVQNYVNGIYSPMMMLIIVMSLFTLSMTLLEKLNHILIRLIVLLSRQKRTILISILSTT